MRERERRLQLVLSMRMHALTRAGDRDHPQGVVQDLLSFLRQRAGQCGLIYARQRETCDSLTRSLRCCSPC